MGHRLLPVALVLAAALADLGGLHDVGFSLLLAAVPAFAVAALACYGELVEAPDRAARARMVRAEGILAALALCSIVAAAASRAHATDEAVPAFAVSALVGCLAVSGAQAVVALLARRSQRA